MSKFLFLALSLAVSAAPATVMAGGNADSGQKLSATCAACHGADGNSTIPTNPKLAGQYESYIVRALTDYKSGARSNAMMAGFAAPLSEQDIRDLAAYFSSQEASVQVLNR